MKSYKLISILFLLINTPNILSAQYGDGFTIEQYKSKTHPVTLRKSSGENRIGISVDNPGVFENVQYNIVYDTLVNGSIVESYLSLELYGAIESGKLTVTETLQGSGNPYDITTTIDVTVNPLNPNSGKLTQFEYPQCERSILTVQVEEYPDIDIDWTQGGYTYTWTVKNGNHIEKIKKENISLAEITFLITEDVTVECTIHVPSMGNIVRKTDIEIEENCTFISAENGNWHDSNIWQKESSNNEFFETSETPGQRSEDIVHIKGHSVYLRNESTSQANISFEKMDITDGGFLLIDKYMLIVNDRVTIERPVSGIKGSKILVREDGQLIIGEGTGNTIIVEKGKTIFINGQYVLVGDECLEIDEFESNEYQIIGDACVTLKDGFEFKSNNEIDFKIIKQP